MSRLILFLVITIAALGQQTVHVEPSVHVTAIDVVADVRDASGEVPRGLTPSDFLLIEEGVERAVIGVEYLRAARKTRAIDAAPEVKSAVPEPVPEWEIVVYFDDQLSSGRSRKRAAEALIRQVDELVRMGNVDVILATPTPSALVRRTRDPEAIKQALRKVAAHPGLNSLISHRRDFHAIEQVETGQALFQAESRRAPNNPGSGSARGGGATFSPIEADTIRPFIDEEMRLIARFRTHLVNWLSTYRRHVPRMLFVVTDGFDLDPLEFYGENLQPNEKAALQSYVGQSRIGQSMEWTSQALAAAGWMTVSMPGDTNLSGWLDDASGSSVGRVRSSANLNTAVSPGRKGLVYRPLDPLNQMADSTGGKVIPAPEKLGRMITELDDRIKVTYQVGRPPDGKARKMELRARDRNFKVHTAKWAASSTPDEMAEARALDLLKSGSDSGELRVQASVRWDASTSERRKGTIQAVADLEPIARIVPPTSRVFRVTFAVLDSSASAFVKTHIVNADRQSADRFRYQAPIEVKATASRIVVTVEEIGTGVWGGAAVAVR
jgi:VWFA-related protein